MRGADAFPQAKGGWSATWAALQQQKRFLYGVKSVTLKYAKRGAGQSGARAFKYQHLPAIRYWNPDVAVAVVKDDAAPAPAPGAPPLPACVELTLADGSVRALDVAGRSAAEILALLQPFATNPSPLRQLFEGKSS